MPRATPTTPTPDNVTQADTPDAPLPATYELALSELEQLVSSMENAALPLDRLLVSYRRAADLLTFCRSRLTAVEAQVKVLEDGQLKPWIAQP
jgi:exodeoxyribonuclease VII small subunit